MKNIMIFIFFHYMCFTCAMNNTIITEKLSALLTEAQQSVDAAYALHDASLDFKTAVRGIVPGYAGHVPRARDMYGTPASGGITPERGWKRNERTGQMLEATTRALNSSCVSARLSENVPVTGAILCRLKDPRAKNAWSGTFEMKLRTENQTSKRKFQDATSTTLSR
mgnify:CR=1 FL=1